MDQPPTPKSDSHRSILQMFAAPPGLRRPRSKTLGKTHICAISAPDLLLKAELAKRSHGNRAILLYYRDEALFRHAIEQVFASSDLPTLVWTDCARLDHTRKGYDVAAAFAIREPALFVFDNFQEIPSALDRPLTFLHWSDGEKLPQLALGSIMVLGVRFSRVSSLPRFSTTVLTRCGAYYLTS
jgi:hypothetical protein